MIVFPLTSLTCPADILSRSYGRVICFMGCSLLVARTGIEPVFRFYKANNVKIKQ
jgi:hypothetical protein